MRPIREFPLDGTPAGVPALADALAAALDGTGPALLPVGANDPGRPTLRAALAPDEPVEPDIAVIVATSGSAGQPKGVLLSAAALIASADATHDALGGPGRWLLATPARFIGGIQVLVRARLGGHPAAVVDLSVPFHGDPFAAAAAAIMTGIGPRYTAMVPTQLARLVDGGGAGLAALRAFDGVLIGGAATSPGLADRARAAGVSIVPAYGMSETASGCVYAGRPLSITRVRLADVDAAGAGRVELAGPMLASGYRRAPAETARAFVDGWFHTGDTGHFDAAGRLEILGRTDDMINTGGVKIAPVLVERVLAAQPGVRAACVVGVPDPGWGQAVVAAVVPTDPADPPAGSDLAAAVRAAAGRAAVPKDIRFVGDLPLRGPGKVDRAAVAILFRD